MRVVSQKSNDELARYCNIPFESAGLIITKEDDCYKILAYVCGDSAPYYLGSYEKEEHAIFVVEAIEAFNLIGNKTLYMPPEKVLLESFNKVGESALKGTTIKEQVIEEVNKLFTTNYWLDGDKLV